MNLPQQVICDALGEVLEAMYFCEGTWAGPGRIGAPAVGATLGFSGKCCSGEFRVLAADCLASQFAADFLAADPSEITPDQTAFVIQEFANVACGVTLGDWMPGEDFSLSVPRALASAENAAEWPHTFLIEGGRPELAIAVNFSRESSSQTG